MSRNPLVTAFYTADPSAHVFEGKVYIYPSHDLDEEAVQDDFGSHYQMTDYRILVQETPEGPAKDCGEALHVRDVPWASKQMWAPDAAYKNGKYYLYFPAKDKEGVFRIGVATSSKPEGPFKAEPQPIKGSFSIDPCVLPDDNGEFYIAFGGLWGGQLQCWKTGSYLRDTGGPTDQVPKGDELALTPKIARLTPDMLQFAEKPRDLVIVDETGQPLKAKDNDRRYFEGPWMHKYQGLYYLSYSTGDTHRLVYATSKTPYGPYTYRGQILTPPIGWTTHHSIVEFKGRWWLYYHDASLSKGISHKRCVKVQELFYNADGTIKLMDP